MKKLTKEEFIERAVKTHGDLYDYSKVNYINSRTKVCIICKKHGEFWQLPNEHIKGKFGCPKCYGNKTLTTEDFINKASTRFNNKYNYSKVNYINNKTKVHIICPEHGDFWQTPYLHLHSLFGCPKCANLHKSNLLSNNSQEFVEKAKKVHGNKYNYSKVKYISAHKPVIITCSLHGDFYLSPAIHLRGCGCSKCAGVEKRSNELFLLEANAIHNYKYKYLTPYIDCTLKICIECPEHGMFTLLPGAHLRGQGCPKCARENNRKKLYYTTSIFIDKSNKIHNSFYNYSLTEYIDSKTPVKIICPIHGEFMQLPVYHLQGCGCKKCHLKSQTRLYNILLKLFPNLEFIFEATCKDIPWAKSYRFDIYNKKYNFIIEYDGEQHFECIDFFGGIEKLNIRKLLDEEKNLLCKENNCTLFRIRYDYTEQDLYKLKQDINLILNLY